VRSSHSVSMGSVLDETRSPVGWSGVGLEIWLFLLPGIGQ
jgi:hypothetical protein